MRLPNLCSSETCLALALLFASCTAPDSLQKYSRNNNDRRSKAYFPLPFLRLLTMATSIIHGTRIRMQIKSDSIPLE
ncbi:uncharacterized protein BO80DRAFT_426742 [Aspergillus ibericus CBS 121593]|uniref:Secreted protein n=1 Tax=Aspergillus ibericus CBS 121593 TaxID=1448316 RepID=A0A395GUW6_9EURO|nr:hypothetical protein BO80DRAFT_426742 [Aspergillus ibericus CBS 121593]RAK99209.1 hypothetical protein BO80DRAFT_426742 [Aspergillus ibericus CBS 121593]